MTAEHKIFNPLSLTRQNVIEPPVKARVVILLSTYLTTFSRVQGFPRSSDGKESACNAGDLGSIPGSERSPWRREWHFPTPVFLPREFHGQTMGSKRVERD